MWCVSVDMRGIFFFSQMGRPHKETKGFEVKVARMDYEFNLGMLFFWIFPEFESISYLSGHLAGTFAIDRIFFEVFGKLTQKRKPSYLLLF